jgi:DNA-directed RNA polymerase specialized sigma24 family protein
MNAGDVPAPPPAWRLSPEAFDRLLACLDADRERAAARYEGVRRKLSKLFAWRGCEDPEALVDLTFDRVARRLDEGAEITAADPYSYFHGVAVRVLQEHWRSPSRGAVPLEVLGSAGPTAPEAPEADPTERRLECLRECLGALPVGTRGLLEQYHHPETGPRIRARKDLAAALGLSATALRLRAYRIRAGLQACVAECERRTETKGPGDHQGS